VTMVQPLQLGFASEASAERISRALGEPSWARDERVEAARRVAELPAELNPLFTTYLDLRPVRFADITPYDRVEVPTDVSSALPEGAAALLHIDEDRLVARALGEEARAAGVIVDTFANVARTRPELVRDAIAGGATLPADDAFAQVARAAAVVGILVHVPAGVTLAEPIVIRWSNGAAGRGLISRTVVSLGAGAHAGVLEEQLASSTPDGGQSLWWGTSEVILGAGATLDLAGQQDFGPSTAAFVNRHATIAADATLRWALATIGGAFQKSRIDNVLDGRGASVSQAEIAFGGGSQLFDLTSYTRHVAEDTTGDLLSKGIFIDRARGYFKGLIQIERTARGTDSFLGEFAMLLTKKARSVAIPSLEIDQPDVRRASHSSSVGPIDEGQIFYLMSRGLDRETARKFIVLGFLEPVVARIPLPEAQERLRALLDAKWPAALGGAPTATAA
jgi:Fe-S cluster assembly protein SufB